MSVVERCAVGSISFGLGVLFENKLICDVVEGVTRDVDKEKLLFHILRHSSGEARELLANVLLKRGPSPSSHFLFLSVAVYIYF